ncbi:hypothetical protein LCGC14_1153200 [marine sediment metagenome]|uniref:Uncharacterized protein n=1 Tax=marine sediment metagenome TaxID=412755 RepID=A0A0F9PD31_9ZZZZ
MSGPADVKKIRDACNLAPNLADVPVGRKLLLQLCDEVERYRVENEDLQHHAETLTEALEGEINSDMTH